MEGNESPRAALEREIKEELGLSIAVGRLLGEFTTPQGEVLIRLQCYWSHVQHGEVLLNAHSAVEWCTAAELKDLDWADADVPAVEVVIDELASDAGDVARTHA